MFTDHLLINDLLNMPYDLLCHTAAGSQSILPFCLFTSAIIIKIVALSFQNLLIYAHNDIFICYTIVCCVIRNTCTDSNCSQQGSQNPADCQARMLNDSSVTRPSSTQLHIAAGVQDIGVLWYKPRWYARAKPRTRTWLDADTTISVWLKGSTGTTNPVLSFELLS